MKQFLESIIKATFKDFLNQKMSDSNNKTEFHFHGTVNFIQREKKKLKNKN